MQLKIILILLLTTLVSSCSVQNNTSPKDELITTEYIQSHIIEWNLKLFKLNLTSIPDFSLPSEIADQVKSIDLASNNIQVFNWANFRNFHNLKEINLPFNQITSIINTEALTWITTLDLTKNQLQSTNWLWNMTALTDLNLSFNSINNINELSSLNNLKSLILAHNNLTDLNPISVLGSLEYIKLEFNNIENISPLSWLNLIKVLTVSHNKLPQELSTNLSEQSLHNMNNPNSIKLIKITWTQKPN